MSALLPRPRSVANVPAQAVLQEVARVCEGCPSRALLDPRYRDEQVEGARAIAMYLLHHAEVGNLSFAQIAALFSYKRQEVERYGELVDEERGNKAKFAHFLEGMIRRLRVQVGLEAPQSTRPEFVSPSAQVAGGRASVAQADNLADWIQSVEARPPSQTVEDLFGAQEEEPEKRPTRRQNGQRPRKLRVQQFDDGTFAIRLDEPQVTAHGDGTITVRLEEPAGAK